MIAEFQSSKKVEYPGLDEILKTVNAKYIQLSNEKKVRNREILKKVLDIIIDELKEDILFKNLFQEPYYGGSFYDGLKVAEPDEFDVDLLLKLPKEMKRDLRISDYHEGYVNLKLENLEKYRKSDQVIRFPNIEKKLLTYDYLDNSKVRSWFEGLITKVLNKNETLVYEGTKISYQLRKSGPAFTLNISTVDFSTKLNIDLVPTFIINEDQWPKGNFKPNITHSDNDGLDSFFLVPKPFINDGDSLMPSNLHWRPSFQKQEKKLIRGNYHLKPAIRLMKKLRDKNNNTFIKSYYIKTVGLLMLEEKDDIWSKPLSEVFMTMLEELCSYLEKTKIPFYWNRETDLFSKVKDDTFKNFVGYIGITKLKSKIKENPKIILDYLLTKEERLDSLNIDEHLVNASDNNNAEENSELNNNDDDDANYVSPYRVVRYRTPTYRGASYGTPTYRGVRPSYESPQYSQHVEEDSGLSSAAKASIAVVGAGVLVLGAVGLIRAFSNSNNRGH